MGIIKYIPMVADIIMELMEAKDIYTQMELDAFAERMVVRGTVTVMEADTSRMNIEIP